MAMVWTDDAVETLRRLAGEGMSASGIAAALGAETRNAVIGKANRIGVKLGGPGGRTGPVAPGSRPRSPGARPGWAFADAEVGEMRRVRFVDVRETGCRWPLGDPGGVEFAFCGLASVEKRPYCAGHCRLAYRPPDARSRFA
ncbi:GcrA cell cycle regulator [Roseiarcus fermentans]|uniref:GcrA cell cycle regulator n=1 Tax=Roseiarcus fermentans TaxID=1473586 RepID=A0A366FIB0_9HYPH|nr:GcrA family cell cycle regulator [Roseiarcus fermentans]RBP14423.1 GcrA cell cycle regulator [Roseiarcus fermentans]